MFKQKLLLADDSITIQKVVNLTFADEGIEVISVGDGNSAMEKFVELTPDLVMVDVNMPGLDGYRICEMIKQDEETKHVPVILLVGSFEPFDENEARRVGANDYLTKPFQSIRQLVSKVSVLLNKSNGYETSAEGAESASGRQIAVDHQIEPAAEPFGDAGMDDEMILTNQIGSQPVDELRKFESVETEPDPSKDVFRSLSEEISAEQDAVYEGDPGKTQPFSADEFRDFSSFGSVSEEFEATEKIFTEDSGSAEERAVSLEKQMVTEFETETNEMVPEVESGVDEVSNEEYPIAAEIIPEEIAAGTQDEFEETENDIEAVVEETNDKPADDENGDWAIYDSPEITEQPQPEEPFHYVEYVTSDANEAEAPETNHGFEETGGIEDSVATESSDESLPEASFADLTEVEPVQQSETFRPELDQSSEVEAPSDEERGGDFAPVADQPVYYEDEDSEDSEVEQSVYVSDNNETEVSEISDQSFDGAATLPSFETAGFDDDAPSTTEIPAPTPTVEEEVSPIQEIPDTEFESSDTGKDPPVNALVSGRDTNEAVESVIVSEFARHSISLSTEAVETIAARIAEKISEKIVQQLATDVVTDLADLIVDRIEQRKRE